MESAEALFILSTKKESSEKLGFIDFNGFLWAINASYYSMFYLARALLEHQKIKLKSEQSIHALTFDALVYYFLLNGKLQKKLIEDLEHAKEEATQLLAQKRAEELIESYLSEKSKRAVFTYEIGTKAMESKAKTSLLRAKRFNKEIRSVLKK